MQTAISKYRLVGPLILMVGWIAMPTLAGGSSGMQEVEEGIYLLPGRHEQMSAYNLGAISNAGFIVGSESVAVVDPGGSLEAGKQLLEAIERVTQLPVNYMILTHFHPDHVAGAAAFKASVEVIAHEHYARAIAQRADFYLERFGFMFPDRANAVFRQPTISVSIGQPLTIDLGGRLLTIDAYPVAHTDNDISVHDIDTNTLWASDLVFAQRTPALDGSLLGWLDVISLMSKKSYGLTIPGHGLAKPWSEIITPQIQYLGRLRDTVREYVDDDVALSSVLDIHETAANENVLWKLYAAQHGSNLAKAYTELEWK